MTLYKELIGLFRAKGRCAEKSSNQLVAGAYYDAQQLIEAAERGDTQRIESAWRGYEMFDRRVKHFDLWGKISPEEFPKEGEQFVWHGYIGTVLYMDIDEIMESAVCFMKVIGTINGEEVCP